MRRNQRLLAAFATAAALTTGLLGPATATPGTPSYTWSGHPSPVVLMPASGQVRLDPVAFCWAAPPRHGTSSEVCSDTTSRDPWAHARTVRTHGRLPFWFGMPRWRFTAHLTRFYNGHETDRRAVRVAPRRFRLPRPALPGLFKVQLFGKGPLGRSKGDVTVRFLWRVG